MRACLPFFPKTSCLSPPFLSHPFLVPRSSDSLIKTRQPIRNTPHPPLHTHFIPPHLFSNLACCHLVVVGQRQTVDWAVRFCKPIISLEFAQATPAYKLTSLLHARTQTRTIKVLSKKEKLQQKNPDSSLILCSQKSASYIKKTLFANLFLSCQTLRSLIFVWMSLTRRTEWYPATHY